MLKMNSEVLLSSLSIGIFFYRFYCFFHFASLANHIAIISEICNYFKILLIHDFLCFFNSI